ncbi:MAG: hypothetical protein ACKN9V_08285, partial [Pseudomonadota bacterium]
MITGLAKKVFGTRNDREIKRLLPWVDEINKHEARLSALSNEALQALTPQYRERLSRGESVDNLLPEAFATVREAG